MRGLTSISIELAKYQLFRQSLIADFPSAEEETLLDTLEGITDLHEMISAVIRSALVDEALHAGLRSRFDDMKERLSRLELRATKKRELALDAMTEAGLTKLEQPDFTASREQALRLSWLSLRTTSQKPTGCRSHRSSIAKRSLESSSAAR